MGYASPQETNHEPQPNQGFSRGGKKILHPALHLGLEMPNLFWNSFFGVDNLNSERFQRSSRIAILGFATQQVDFLDFSLRSNPINKIGAFRCGIQSVDRNSSRDSAITVSENSQVYE
jgi:hypothetical protein